jgi:nucleotide-binding universal stress UspA family protein
MGTRAETSLTPPVPMQTHGIRRILICVDGSLMSEIGIPYAVCIAETFGSALTLLYVQEARAERVGPHGAPHSTDALGWEIARREATDYLERMGRRASELSGRYVESRLEQGHPAERIAALAREVGADLTVLGSHGEGGIAAWNLGSTVQQVLSLTRGSVLIARARGPSPEVIRPARILVPLDGSQRTESVLPIAARIANTHGSEILLTHVVEEPQPSGVLCEGEDLELAFELARRLEARAARYLERIRAQLASEGAPVRATVIRHKGPHQSLIEFAEREQVDLVIASAHGATCHVARSFGVVTAHLLAHSKIALLVLQDLPDPAMAQAVGLVDDEAAPPLRASFPPGSV